MFGCHVFPTGMVVKRQHCLIPDYVTVVVDRRDNQRSSSLWKTKRRRSDPVLWQKSLHQQKCQKSKVTAQTTPQKSSIKQQLRTDCERQNTYYLPKFLFLYQLDTDRVSEGPAGNHGVTMVLTLEPKLRRCFSPKSVNAIWCIYSKTVLNNCVTP